MKSSLNFERLEKKKTLITFVFSKLRTPKTWLDKRVKSSISEDLSTRNMVNVPKLCLNLHHITFSIFIDHCQVYWVGKSLFYWHANSWHSFLTLCLPMKSILFLIETIWQYQFRWNYLRKKKLFLKFLRLFWSLAQILNVFKKKMALIAFIFSKLPTPKTWLYKCLKSLFSEDPSTSKIVNVPKHYGVLDHICFVIFIDCYQVNWVGKNPSNWYAESWVCLLTHWLPMKIILFLIETI